jgi:predicted transcriptional regulator
MDIESIGSVEKRGQEMCSVAPDATVYDALALMAAKNLAAVLVISEGKLVGIVSARDYGCKVILEGKSARDVRVREVMTTYLVTVTPEATVLDPIVAYESSSFSAPSGFEGRQARGRCHNERPDERGNLRASFHY